MGFGPLDLVCCWCFVVIVVVVVVLVFLVDTRMDYFVISRADYSVKRKHIRGNGFHGDCPRERRVHPSAFCFFFPFFSPFFSSSSHARMRRCERTFKFDRWRFFLCGRSDEWTKQRTRYESLGSIFLYFFYFFFHFFLFFFLLLWPVPGKTRR